MNLSTAPNKAEVTEQALKGLDTVAEDISMIALGEWIPDEEGCACSLEIIQRIRTLVTELST